MGGIIAASALTATIMTFGGVLDVEASGPAYERLYDGSAAPAVEIGRSYLTAVTLDRNRSAVTVEISPAEGVPPDHQVAWEILSEQGDVRTGRLSAGGTSRFHIQVPYSPGGASDCTMKVTLAPQKPGESRSDDETRELQVSFPCTPEG